MNTTQQSKEIVGHIAATAASKAATQATRHTGWRRWVWGLIAATAAAIAWFTTTGTAPAPQQEPAAAASTPNP